jgi:hypothetical protein
MCAWPASTTTSEDGSRDAIVSAAGRKYAGLRSPISNRTGTSIADNRSDRSNSSICSSSRTIVGAAASRARQIAVLVIASISSSVRCRASR